MQFEINIKIDSTGLNNIYSAGQFVTLVNRVSSMVETAIVNSMPTGVMLAWITFQPFQNNFVTWNDKYYIYATTTALVPGNIVFINSVTDVLVQMGWTYTFKNGHFTAALGGMANAFTVDNQMKDIFGFGLARYATINNVAAITPLSAVSALFNQEMFITPTTDISIFLSSAYSSGTILYKIPDNALTLQLTGQKPTVIVAFNDQKNTFYSN